MVEHEEAWHEASGTQGELPGRGELSWGLEGCIGVSRGRNNYLSKDWEGSRMSQKPSGGFSVRR